MEYNNEDYINKHNNDYYAWICLDKEELTEPVPEHFPNSKGKTWSNYSTIVEVDGNSFVVVGYRDQNGNRKDRITDEEFQLWVDHFNGRNIWTLGQAREYMKQFIQDDAFEEHTTKEVVKGESIESIPSNEPKK